MVTSDRMNHPRAGVVAVVLKGYPRLSETFIAQELHALEARGVLASAGSACASKTAGPSPTLKAVGIDDRTAVLRFSFSRLSRPADADAAVAALVEAAAELASGRARR